MSCQYGQQSLFHADFPLFLRCCSACIFSSSFRLCCQYNRDIIKLQRTESARRMIEVYFTYGETELEYLRKKEKRLCTVIDHIVPI